MFHQIIRNVPPAAVQISRSSYQRILLCPEPLNSGCPAWVIPAAAARSHTRPAAPVPEAAAAKADKDTRKRSRVQRFRGSRLHSRPWAAFWKADVGNSRQFGHGISHRAHRVRREKSKNSVISAESARYQENVYN